MTRHRHLHRILTGPSENLLVSASSWLITLALFICGLHSHHQWLFHGVLRCWRRRQEELAILSPCQRLRDFWQITVFIIDKLCKSQIPETKTWSITYLMSLSDRVWRSGQMVNQWSLDQQESVWAKGQIERTSSNTLEWWVIPAAVHRGCKGDSTPG
jgi:hypothetical protein